MNEEQQLSTPRPTARAGWLTHSLSALLLVAIAVLGLRLTSAAREESALRQELTQLRAEGGHLDIEDPNKIYAVRIPSQDADEWAWRIYLPTTASYQRFNYHGRMADPSKLSDPRRHEARRAGSGTSGSIQSGEYVFRVKMEENQQGQWLTKTITAGGWSMWGQKMKDDWLKNRDWEESSDVPLGRQREFASDAVVELLRLRNESAVSADDPNGNTETIVVWIAGENTKQ